MKRGLMKKVIRVGEVNFLVGDWTIMVHRAIRYFVIASISLLRITGLALPITVFKFLLPIPHSTIRNRCDATGLSDTPLYFFFWHVEHHFWKARFGSYISGLVGGKVARREPSVFLNKF